MVARDGDAGSPRSLSLRLEGDRASLFELRFEPGAAVEADGTHRAQIVVSGNGVIDREQEVGNKHFFPIYEENAMFNSCFSPQSILSEGGLYAFQVVAEEVVGPEEDAASAPPAEKAVANVTLVVTDQDDQVKIAHIKLQTKCIASFMYRFCP